MPAPRNDLEVDVIAQFRIVLAHPLEITIFQKIVVISIKKMNEMDARARSCTDCDKRVEERKKVFQSATVVEGIGHITVEGKKMMKFRRGEIPFENLLFTQDTPD